MPLIGAIVKMKDNVGKAPGSSECPKATVEDPGIQVRSWGPLGIGCPTFCSSGNPPLVPLAVVLEFIDIHCGPLGVAELCGGHMVTCAIFTPL